MRSEVIEIGKVEFPEFIGERVYMREFTKDAGLPRELSRWQTTVDSMLNGVDSDGPIFLMIDQAYVESGRTHRRPGVHVDGYWHPGSGHRDDPYPRHSFGRHGHVHAGSEQELLILASDVTGCVGYVGDYDGVPDEDGDCSHIILSGLDVVEFAPNKAYAGHTLTMLHESIPVRQDCLRTIVRLNVVGATLPVRNQA